MLFLLYSKVSQKSIFLLQMPGEVIYTGLFHPSLLDNLLTLITDSEPDYSASGAMLKRKLEKAMAPHSSTLAWKIPWTEEPVGCNPWGR